MPSRSCLLGVGVESALQLHDVHGHVAFLEGVLGQAGCLGEEAGERARVADQVVHRLLLAGLVVPGQGDRVIHEELWMWSRQRLGASRNCSAASSP